ncbi:MAG: DUF4381 domain-containing protein [Lysobacterales bacterium]
MNPEDAQLLARLRDIHGAADPGWWPPAPGWWVLALLLLLALALALRALARSLAVARRRRRWLQALDALERESNPAERPHDYLANLNRLFRAVAVKAFPGTGCARLQGFEWVAFIRSLLPENPAADSLEALASGPYEPAPQFDAAALREQARAWVRRYG